jgi:peptidoglycan/LPS O-acetylase OafA/YrhL
MVVRQNEGRLPSLDGLRGVAAVIVVLYHSSLIARPYLDGGTHGDAWWVLTETPLKVLTAGTESVLVFFALSGLVVALPAMRDGFSWRGYFASRLVRLYLPVWGALGLASALVYLVPRDASVVTTGSWMDDASVVTVSIRQLLSEASLARASYDIVNVLWSLRWEVVFSLLLPVFIVLARLAARRWPVAVLIATAVMIVGRTADIDALKYVPVFFLGSLLAVRIEDVMLWAARRSSGEWATLAAASVLLIIASWIARPIAPAGSTPNLVLSALAGLGATVAVIVALGSPLARRALSSRVPRWLGAVSFSLYLVHVPVLQTITFALGDERWPLAIAIGVPASFAIAQAFSLFVERPSHRLARRISRAVSGRKPREEPSPTGE